MVPKDWKGRREELLPENEFAAGSIPTAVNAERAFPK